ncbi:MAG: long-chain fatty acid--CoA ligase [Nitrospinota bacterium]|nr:long-chain fatty acid--CoA ligase [Nitrospinota bacterium]
MSGTDFSTLPKTIDLPDKPLGHFFEEAAAKYPDRTAMVFMKKEYSYAETDRQVRKFMNVLRANGVNKGDVVALMSPNCPQAIITYQAAMRVGAIVTQLSPLYVANEVEHQLKDSGAKVAVVANLMAPVFSRGAGNTGMEKVIIFNMQDYMAWPISWIAPLIWRFKEKRDMTMPTGSRYIMWDALMDKASEKAENTQIAPDDLALYQYTGGTTGTSKGVELTHRNLVANTLQGKAWFIGAEEGKETMILALPIFHVFGMTVGMNLGFAMGMRLIVIPKFEAAEVMGLIEKYKATFFPGVPLMYQKINDSPSALKHDMSTIKFCLSGAAPLPRVTKERFESLTGGKLVEGYGLTEASPCTHCNPLIGGDKVGSIGLALPSTEQKVLHAETGEVAKTGETGELLIRGPQVMLGYKGKPEETANVIIDGWLYTGDMGYIDEDGFVFLVDRKKEMVITGGLNVYCTEVEGVLRKMEGVADVAIIGEPDPTYGENVVAVIVRKEGSSISDKDVIAYSKANVAGYKVPKKVVFLEELPKTIIGKVLKREIKKILKLQPA